MSSSAAAATVTADHPVAIHGELFGHPKGLYVLFFTEMWERFSYYGMRALLTLYMTTYLIGATEKGAYVFGFGAIRGLLESIFGPLAVQPLASQIYGTYTAFVYLTPLFGGMIADRVLGQRKTVYLGGILMAIGHFLMAIESMFMVALMFLILGNGCFKPNISTQVGSLYKAGDQRRDGAFAIFYMGINLGAFLSPLVCGTLGQKYGWHYGFTAAGIGMIVGLLVYAWGQKYLAPDQLQVRQEKHVEKQPLTSGEKKAVWGLIGLCALNIVFWAVYEQQGNTLQVFADQNADWHVFGWEMPSTWFQSMNPLFIFMMAPLLNMFWNWQAAKGKPMSSVMKMATGCILLGLSFLILIFATRGMQQDSRISFLWLMALTYIYTLGELYLSPIGLSLVTKVSPVKLVSTMMGMWFLSSFFGNYLCGYIGMFYDGFVKSGNLAGFLWLLTALGVGSGLAIAAFSKPLKNAIGSDV